MNKAVKKSTPKSMYVILVLSIIATVLFWRAYTYVFSENVFFKNNESAYLFAIPTGSNVSGIAAKLAAETKIQDTSGFVLLSKLVKLNSHIHPGLYELKKGMSNKDIVLLFRSGKRKPVDLTIKFERYSQDIPRMVAPKLEANYEEMLSLLEDENFLDSLGFTKQTAICLFIPDTYEFNWNTSAKNFIARMNKEYKKFWTEERLQKAKDLGLTPQQVMTVASIINQESNKNDEKSRIAGVYLNRLEQNMPLQADPTVKYAVGDFTIKRVRKGHLLKNSPYNTYMYPGLPPGPICTPSKVDIDAVLNREKHNYIFFCAKPDFSGYHRFAETYEQHLQYAHEYSKWLDSENIQ
jgi:UPF0755 protein